MFSHLVATAVLHVVEDIVCQRENVRLELRVKRATPAIATKPDSLGGDTNESRREPGEMERTECAQRRQSEAVREIQREEESGRGSRAEAERKRRGAQGERSQRPQKKPITSG